MNQIVMTATDARRKFCAAVRQAEAAGDRILIVRHSYPRAALIGPADLERLRWLDGAQAAAEQAAHARLAQNWGVPIQAPEPRPPASQPARKQLGAELDSEVYESLVRHRMYDRELSRTYLDAKLAKDQVARSAAASALADATERVPGGD